MKYLLIILLFYGLTCPAQVLVPDRTDADVMCRYGKTEGLAGGIRYQLRYDFTGNVCN